MRSESVGLLFTRLLPLVLGTLTFTILTVPFFVTSPISKPNVIQSSKGQSVIIVVVCKELTNSIRHVLMLLIMGSLFILKAEAKINDDIRESI
jgi:hypothetical protein